MNLGEKMSYLQGLLDGLEIDKTTKEGKLLVQITEVMQEMVESIDDVQAQVDELAELCDVIDEDLGAVEEEVFDCHDDDCCCHHDDDDDDDYDDYDLDEYDFDEDDELYEVQCPICEESVVLDESMLAEGSIECPCCGEMLEFDYIGEDEEETEAENNEQ